MKAVSDLQHLPPIDLLDSAVPSRTGDFVELTKVRLNAMVLITTLIGFVVAPSAGLDWWLLLQTLIGTGLCAAGASVLNQAWEWQHDKKMTRTADRPVAAGRIPPGEATLLGLLMSACGTLTLALAVNVLSASLAAATIVLYVLVYTPMKRLTAMNTLVGAIPGAIPPMIGYAAVANHIGLEAWGLFALMFAWQMPHFLAIAILCHEDYAAAGYKMMPVVDGNLARTSRWIVAWGVILIAASLIPLKVQPTGWFYITSAVVLGLCFLASGVYCAIKQTRPAARTAFFGSIIYLPLVLGALMIDRLL